MLVHNLVMEQDVRFGFGKFCVRTSCAWSWSYPEDAFPRKSGEYKIVLSQVVLGLGGTQGPIIALPLSQVLGKDAG